MFELIRGKYRQVVESIQYDIARMEFEKESLDVATKQLKEAARNIVRDTEIDNGDWKLLGGSGSVGTMDPEEHSDMQAAAYNMYHTNLYARALIRALVKFVFGKGPQITPGEEENEKVKEVWAEFRRINKLNQREKEIGVRAFRDGEVFIRKFTDETDGTIKIRFIRATSIANPKDKQNLSANVTFGIETDPDDIETPLSYYVVNGDGNFVANIPAEEIIHLKILSDSDQKRGISILRVSAKRLKQYDEWLEDRIVLNKVRSAIALVRNVEGSAGSIKSIREQERSTGTSGDRQKIKLPPRGTVITASKGIKYEMLSPNVQAADVANDGRAMLLSVAAAHGVPEMIFTADTSNANYASSLVAQNPWVREIEDWQDFFSTLYEELFKDVIEAGIKYGELPEKTKTTCRVEFPPMIQADLKELAEAYEILFRFKAVSKKTWQIKMGLDPDLEDANMENEDGDDLFNPTFGPDGKPLPQGPQDPNKFNLPIAPVNQYGAKIYRALREGNLKLARELVDELEQKVQVLEGEV